MGLPKAFKITLSVAITIILSALFYALPVWNLPHDEIAFAIAVGTEIVLAATVLNAILWSKF